MEEFLLTTTGTAVLIVLLIWSAVWKGLALWRSSQKNQVAWFVVFMILNTAGILEIIYLYLISPQKKSESKSK